MNDGRITHLLFNRFNQNIWLATIYLAGRLIVRFSLNSVEALQYVSKIDSKLQNPVSPDYL